MERLPRRRSSGTSDPPTIFLESTAVDPKMSTTAGGGDQPQLERDETFSTIRQGCGEEPAGRAAFEDGEEDPTSEPTSLILGAGGGEQHIVTEIRHGMPPPVQLPRRHRALLFKIAILVAEVVVVAGLATLVAMLVVWSNDGCGGEEEVVEEVSLTVALELVGITQIIQEIVTMNVFEDVCGDF